MMTRNKKTIEKYMEGFRVGDHRKILSCLADNVVWEIPGMFHITGKEAFNKEIENDAFVGHPDITVIRMIEENNIVIAEGEVHAKKREGGLLEVVFCDVFHMQNGKINKLTSYLMEK